MIGKLKGKVESIGEDEVLLDVGGVCYEVFLSARSLSTLPGTGEATSLLIDTHVREDHIHLYGFTSSEEQGWFRLLTTVQGVGAKMGLAILGVLSPDELTQAIHARDAKLLTRANGVGPKLAERIINELKNKLEKLPTAAFMPAASAASNLEAPSRRSGMDEAVSALVNLGYGRSEAFAAVSLAQQKSATGNLDDLIRLGLQELAR